MIIEPEVGYSCLVGPNRYLPSPRMSPGWAMEVDIREEWAAAERSTATVGTGTLWGKNLAQIPPADLRGSRSALRNVHL
jgi:hypothetical protein